MEFEPASTERRETRVNVTPSSPDGYFRISGDPFCPPYVVSSIALRGIKPRHVRALRDGDESVMERYVVRNPEQPHSVSFTQCEPVIPDPLQPIGTAVPVREAQEVYLDRSSRIDDAHSAVGRWWARYLLNSAMDSGYRNLLSKDAADRIRAKLERKADDLALILAHLSRTNDRRHISTDYRTDRTLRTAAGMAFVSAPTSLGSYTEINSDGIVTAREGQEGEIVQIWPPVSDASSPNI